MIRFAVLLWPVLLSAQSTVSRPPSLSDPFQYITPAGRANWFYSNTAGPVSLLIAGPWSAGFGTLTNRPEEYGRTWRGFGQRYGMRLTGVSVGNAIEVTSGAIWGEDPRYFRMGGSDYKRRVKYVLVSPFFSKYRDGERRLSYARIIATPGNNFLSNLWRVESEATVTSALSRTALGYLGRLTAHGFSEFWPDIQQRVFKKKPKP
jgi:hypothetical protein